MLLRSLAPSPTGRVPRPTPCWRRPRRSSPPGCATVPVPGRRGSTGTRAGAPPERMPWRWDRMGGSGGIALGEYIPLCCSDDIKKPCFAPTVTLWEGGTRSGASWRTSAIPPTQSLDATLTPHGLTGTGGSGLPMPATAYRLWRRRTLLT